MRYLALIALAACGGGSSGPSEHVAITARAGGQPAGGVTVVAHTVDGVEIDDTVADAVGHATIGDEPGALVSVIFPATVADETTPLTIVTAPLTDGMTIVGPEDATGPGLIVGAVQLQPPPIQADAFEIQLGCTTVHVTAMPTVVDVPAPCMGSDTMLDVLITASEGGAPVGYVAGRVQLIDGAGQLDPAAWETTSDPLPVTVSRADATLTWSLVTDGLPFTSPVGQVPHGLAFDHLVVEARSEGQQTTRWIPTVPSEIAITDADFLPPIDVTLAPGYTWTAANLGDAVDLRASWDHVTWHAVLPPDATMVAFPPGTVDAPAAPDLALRYVDSSLLDGFPATEIHADTIVPPVVDGQIEITQADGVR